MFSAIGSGACKMLANWTLDINSLISIMSVAAIGGMGWQSIKQLRRDFEKLEKEVIDFRDLKADIAVIRSQLDSLHKIIKKDNEQ